MGGGGGRAPCAFQVVPWGKSDGMSSTAYTMPTTTRPRSAHQQISYLHVNMRLHPRNEGGGGGGAGGLQHPLQAQACPVYKPGATQVGGWGTSHGVSFAGVHCAAGNFAVGPRKDIVSAEGHSAGRPNSHTGATLSARETQQPHSQLCLVHADVCNTFFQRTHCGQQAVVRGEGRKRQGQGQEHHPPIQPSIPACRRQRVGA